MNMEAITHALEIARLGNRAVREAQRENHRHGLPNVFSLHKRLYFELPDGTITMENPLTAEKTENNSE